ncbi:MAG: LuxR C-terminal-related transcriptional regulator, partial [Ancrocorticia sp.]
ELAEYLRDSGDDSLYEYVDAMPENLRCHQYGRLSRAELRTLCELANGEPLENTAGSLFISINTLKFHLRSIYRKLHVSNRHEAVQRAQLLGLYTPNQSWGGMRGGKAKE